MAERRASKSEDEVSAGAVIRIMVCPTDPRIRPRPDRIVRLAVSGAALAADEMPRDLRRWHAPGQAQNLGIEIEAAPAGKELPLWKAGGRDLRRLAVPSPTQ